MLDKDSNMWSGKQHEDNPGLFQGAASQHILSIFHHYAPLTHGYLYLCKLRILMGTSRQHEIWLSHEDTAREDTAHGMPSFLSWTRTDDFRWASCDGHLFMAIGLLSMFALIYTEHVFDISILMLQALC